MRRAFCTATFLACMLLWPSASSASTVPTLQFQPSAQTIGLNDTVSVDVVLANLASAPCSPSPCSTSVGGFDLAVQFTPDVLSFIGINYFPYLGSPDSEAITQYSLLQGEVVQFSEVSLLSSAELDALQGSFKDPSLPLAEPLAQLYFLGVGTGSSPLDFTHTLVSDVNGSSIFVDSESGSISVPEPATGVLLSLALGFLLAIRAKQVT